ncbi:MAG: cobalamin-binding protein [Sphingomonadales bacterium]|nr:cobalamin-binding protein [Sphingomonadales bacterium]PIX64922.1 MAG: cobalamin-binding protein [Sphingomonadales bacterium CG_4_10_14_3_um_filter_58_15]NCO48535.1 cobalamin-binding protein [Sphingomonadales bacterium]NCP00540.1 cobalamin-binding protein [Sphingomonadales bacterium]NCP25764.1 cobalamin-binding protein [Sphingomonadales bacterium]
MTSDLRVVSLLPSATEIAVALGLEPNLVGRSHECDYPNFVRDLPICTSTKLEKGLQSDEIDKRVQEIVRQGLSVYEVDAPLLQSLKPDVILTQSQCAVCAVTPDDLEEALASWIGQKPQLISLAPDNLDDVWGDFRKVGVAVDRSAEAEQSIKALQKRLRELGPDKKHRPTVAAIEWIEPLMVAGNWVPELIEIAGGKSLFATAGQHSPWLEWDALLASDPDKIIFMPCGYQIGQTLAEMPTMVKHPHWAKLSAVKNGEIFLADGHHFFNRPGPRLVESAQIIADTLYAEPDDNGDLSKGWIRWTG